MSGYIGPQPVPQATQHREAFTATASQTYFATVGYTPQFVDVYLNGVKLAAADYTATNGSDIVLTTGAALNDILEYVAYTPFEVASQTFTGTTTADALTVTGAFTSKGIDDNATSTAITIGASKNVGIGEAAPATLLHLSANNAGITTAGTGNNTLRFEDNDPTKIQGQVTGTIDWYTNDADATGVQAWITANSTNVGAGALVFGTGVAGATEERLRIDASGNVGINTASPSAPLDVVATSAGTLAEFRDGVASNFIIETSSNTTTIGNQAGSSQLAFKTSNDEAMRIDASGNVGIGTAVPGSFQSFTYLDIVGKATTQGGVVRAKTSDSSVVAQMWASSIGGYYGTTTNHPAFFNTNNTERMRIDASGNVLVGTTVTTPAQQSSVTGVSLRTTGAIESAANGSAARFNRLTSDGGIIELRKDGTPVGSIGSATSGYSLYFQAGDVGLKMEPLADDIKPCTSNGANRSGAIDLGDPAATFKDLYLSGGVYLGGTGAANKLDDYEEGTWTPTIYFGGASVGVTYSATRNGFYTKTGNQVTVSCYFVLTSKGTSTGAATVGGLPFTSTSAIYSFDAAVLRLQGVTFADVPMGFQSVNSAAVALEEITNAGTISALENTNFSNNSQVMMSVTYRV